MPRSTHAHVAHHHAQIVIDYLISQGGGSIETSRAIARMLGMTVPQFHSARRHTITCAHLGGYVVAYRGLNRAIVLLDPTDTGRLVQALVNDRSDPMFLGARRLRDNWTVAQSRIVAIIETAARESLAAGNKPVADALFYAARDYQTVGEIQPATAALLRSLGVSP